MEASLMSLPNAPFLMNLDRERTDAAHKAGILGPDEVVMKDGSIMHPGTLGDWVKEVGKTMIPFGLGIVLGGGNAPAGENVSSAPTPSIDGTVPPSLQPPDPNVDLNNEFPPNTPSGTGTGTGTGTGSGIGVTDFLNSDLGKTLLSFGLGTASGALARQPRQSLLGTPDPLGDQISNSIRRKQTQINQGVSFPDAGKVGQPPQFNGPSLPSAFGVTGGDRSSSSLFPTPPSSPDMTKGPAQGPEGVKAAFAMLGQGMGKI